MHDTIVCPACGQRSSVRDPSHFEPFGRWEGHAVVTCRVCGSGLSVSPGLRRPRARLIDPNLWRSLKEVRRFAPPASRARPASGDSGAASTGVQGLEIAARELSEARARIQGALELLKTLPLDRHDPRRMALHHELATALVLVRDLALDVNDGIEARAGSASDGRAATI